MSLDKSIRSGREQRKKFRKSKAWDHNCRNNGACNYCRDGRTHTHKVEKSKADFECQECFDTGCCCGGIGYSCDGCCSCIGLEGI